MDLLAGLLDFFIHLDQHLQALLRTHGGWVYAILFAIVFFETGVIVTPFLPGDSLLFVGATLAAAGVGQMDYGRFLLFNVSGAVLWVVSLAYAGYFFGNLAFVKNNLTLIIVAIVIASLMPGVIEWWR